MGIALKSVKFINQVKNEHHFSGGLLSSMLKCFNMSHDEFISYFYEMDMQGKTYAVSKRVRVNSKQIIQFQRMNSIKNRDVNQGYKVHMENFIKGTYVCTYDPMMFDTDGNMVNFGHRVNGAFHAGIKSLDFNFVPNVSQDVILASDQAKKRTPKAHMFMIYGIEESSHVWNLCNMSWFMGPYPSLNRQSIGNSNIKDYYDRNCKTIEAFFTLLGKFKTPDGFNKRSIHRALYLIYVNNISINANEYIEKFITGVNADDDTLDIRTAIMDGETRGENALIRSILSDSYYQFTGKTYYGDDLTPLFIENRAPISLVS